MGLISLTMWILIYTPLILLLMTLATITLLATLSFRITNKRSLIRYYSKFLFYYAVTLTVALVTFPISMVYRDIEKLGPKATLAILKIVSYVWGISFKLQGMSHLPKSGCVLVTNHQSSIDILGFFYLWSFIEKLTTVAKKELLHVWPLGITAKKLGIVFVDRKNAEEARKTLESTSSLMRTKNYKILIFPEGTRNLDRKQPMLPFKRGAFLTAIHAQVPIVPVLFSPYYFLNHENYFFDDNPRVYVEVLEPIPTSGMDTNDVPKLIRLTRTKMEECYQRHLDDIIEKLGPDPYPGILR